MKNKSLSLVIPTFNRPEILKENILLMLPDIQIFSIPIYVSDDSSNNHTKDMIFELQKRYEYLFYYKNIPSLGHDKNIFSTLKLAETEYVWLLGDALILKAGAIKNILKIVTKFRPEIIAVNAVNRDLSINSDFYDDKNKVLNEFGWHLTLTGATIYSRTALSAIDKIVNGVHKNFPQVTLIFNHLSVSCSFYWVNERWIYSNGKKTSYWVKDIFQIFIDDWSNVIRNLQGCYDDGVKEKVIIKHSQKAKVFTLKSLAESRSKNVYNIHVFRAYSKLLAKHSGLRIIVLVMIAIVPKTVLRIFQAIKQI